MSPFPISSGAQMMGDFLKLIELDFDPAILTANPLPFLLPQLCSFVAAVSPVSSLCLRGGNRLQSLHSS